MKRRALTPNVSSSILKSVEKSTMCKCNSLNIELFPISRFSKHSTICPVHIRYMEKIKKG
jgi:hypothetical protein